VYVSNIHGRPFSKIQSNHFYGQGDRKLKLDGSELALRQIQDAAKLRIYLDYDGTLADFAPTPDAIYPDPELIALLERLKNDSRFKVAVISGRRLSHIQTLLPVPGIMLAGTYGIELLDPSGQQIDRVDFETIRPALEVIKPQWIELLRPHRDFYLEDKGWSLAIHAKFVDQSTADETITQARRIIDQVDLQADLFRILGGYKFLEVAPTLANKGITTGYLMSSAPLEEALPLYIGDDDKDEEAFDVILQNSGVAIKVCSRPCDTKAQLCIESPQAVRQFLASLL
jgi:trehalose-phosphatase